MKLNKKLTVVLIILLILLISMISFVGIYVQSKNKMKSVVEPYTFAMDIDGARRVDLEVDDTVNTIYYDKDGNKVEEKAEDGTEEEVPVNKPENLTQENYVLAKKIIENRLKDAGVDNYLIRLDENKGKIIAQLPENENTDTMISFLYTVGNFTLEDEEGQVLLDKSNLQEVKVGYGATTLGTNVYLQLVFNEDVKEKLREISNTYKSTEEDSTAKKVVLKIDDGQLTSTSFSEEITDGIIPLTIGSASTNNEELKEYIKEAGNIAVLLNNDSLPITYKMNQNRYVQSSITDELIVTIGIVVATIIGIALIILIVRYKKNGLLTSIAYIGYASLLLLVLRYTKVSLSIEGIFGILINFVLNYMFTVYVLKQLKKEESSDSSSIKRILYQCIIQTIFILISVMVIGIVMCFTKWLPMNSLGAVIFWGILLLFIYNLIVTRTLLIYSAKKE